ncbi:hairy and enhancer of split-related protein HELT [Ornithorhynchus anatinus]|uniref:hairy and enhancer of split-related protein HELT n=1 Tax=Ornithorhynchus anatinus TaxID=9258 RepID=UPI0019D4A611|nr:hairy and enhancer of split-related protein HELT [Ornithorhynchus anatinus]
MAGKGPGRKRAPVSHKVIEKRRRDRINRCLSELGKTVPMALVKQSSGKLEKAEILELTVQYLRALHAADFPRGRDKELLTEFAHYFHSGYHECMKNLVHYLTTVERLESKDTKYARVLAFLQSRARLGPVALGSPPEPDRIFPPLPLPPAGPEPCDPSAAAFPGPGPFPWPRGPAMPPYLPGSPAPLPSPAQPPSPFLTPVQGLDRRYLHLLASPAPPGL